MTISNAYLYRMPAGIAGDVTRAEQATVVPEQMDTDYPVLRFGEPVKLESGKARPLTTGDDGSEAIGFGVRPFPTQASTSEAIAAATPNTTQIFDILRRGFMTVYCQNGSPSKRGAVYCRVANATTDHPLGGIEAAADGGDCVAITSAYFEGEVDSNGFVEISYNI